MENVPLSDWREHNNSLLETELRQTVQRNICYILEKITDLKELDWVVGVIASKFGFCFLVHNV